MTIDRGRSTFDLAMCIVPTHDPEVLRIDDDSIAMRLMGLIPILSVVSFWAIFFNNESGWSEDAGAWEFLFMFLGSLLAALLGLTMMLYSGQTIIDRRLGKVVHWQRFLWWQPSYVHELEDFDRVAVVRSSGRYLSWGIELQPDPPDQATNVSCGMGLTRSDAFAFAEQIAAFSGLKIS